MRFPKFFSLLLAFFVMSAAFPGNMALASGARDTNGLHAMSANCHASANADTLPASLVAAHDHALHGRHGHDMKIGAQAQHDDCPGTSSHGCFNTGCASVTSCSGFIGLFPLTEISSVIPNAQEAIPFRASLYLDAHVTGIYHPPRQHA
ncbi:MAG: hypothetical protein LBF51_07990 [Zoogloeaceae bacterium]|jgi:hypothetical protein|nr:hypothetical protein [Zoogloeaceae bacterium]